MSRHRSSSPISGFTLVETMMVMAIMVMLFAAAASGMKKAWQGQEIRAAAIHLAHGITLASQTAVKLNKPVELRFYKYRDERIATTEPQFVAWQLVTREPSADDPKGKVKPLFELQRCEGTTIMSPHRIDSTLCSTLLGPPTKTDAKRDPDLGVGKYEYVSVEFLPSGRTNLDPEARSPWTLTLIPVIYADRPGEMPKEFQCVGIDARSGAVRIW